MCCVILPGRRMAGSPLPSRVHLMPIPGPWAGVGISEGFRSLEMKADHPSDLSVLYCSRVTSGVAGQDLLLHPSASALEGLQGMEREQQGRGLRPGSISSLEGTLTTAQSLQDSLHMQALKSQALYLPQPPPSFHSNRSLPRRSSLLRDIRPCH